MTMSLVSAGGHRFSTRPCLRSTVRRRGGRVRAALVEARPAATPPIRVITLAKTGDRADDLQAEARAMARAANSSFYTPELLALKYGSQPIKVLLLLLLLC